MVNGKKSYTLICIFLILIVFRSNSVYAVNHPYIIVTEAEYPQLIEKSQEWPWSEMKESAKSKTLTMNVRMYADINQITCDVHDLAGAAALAFILDPGNKTAYLNVIEQKLKPAMARIRIKKENGSDDHGYNVGPAHAAFAMYLLLDIVYNDVDTALRQTIENDCDYIALNHKNSWKASKYAIEGLSELYHNGCSEIFITKKNDYKNYVLDNTTADGIYGAGPGYAESRFNMDNRMQKKIFMDICEYQGYHEFYSNPRLQNLYEWHYGYSVTPFNRSYTFGDSPPTKQINDWSVAALRVNRFSRLAQSYAVWYIGEFDDSAIKGHLMQFLLCDSLPVTKQKPTSRIFNNGGAWLTEDNHAKDALAGALWNIETSQLPSHAHFEVNAIHIAAYGQHVLRNSGYDGWGEPAAETWEWLHNTAESSNTLMLSHKNHQSKYGGGITEGLLDADMDYVNGSSDKALVLADHARNFHFIKPSIEQSNGYFFVVDEVYSGFIWKDDVPVSTAWHPNSGSEPTITQDSTVFTWPSLGGCCYGENQVGLSICLATKPDEINIRKGYLGSYDACSRFNGKYLYNTYYSQDNQVSALTFFIPFDQVNPAPGFHCISLESVDAAKIDHGNNCVDYVFATLDTGMIEYDHIQFQGKTCFWRETNKEVDWYFLRESTSFHNNRSDYKGFETQYPVTIKFHGNIGTVISDATEIKFFDKNIESVLIDQSEATINDRNDSFVSISLDSGKHDIALLYNNMVVKGQVNLINDFQLFQNYPNPFNPTTSICYSLYVQGHVELKVFNVLGEEVASLVNQIQNAGEHRVLFDASNFTNGVYFYQLKTSDQTCSRKLLIVK